MKIFQNQWFLNFWLSIRHSQLTQILFLFQVAILQAFRYPWYDYDKSTYTFSVHHGNPQVQNRIKDTQGMTFFKTHEVFGGQTNHVSRKTFFYIASALSICERIQTWTYILLLQKVCRAESICKRVITYIYGYVVLFHVISRPNILPNLITPSNNSSNFVYLLGKILRETIGVFSLWKFYRQREFSNTIPLHRFGRSLKIAI